MAKVILILVVFCTSILGAQDLYFPPNIGGQWEEISPGELNWCQDSLDALQQFLADKNSKAFIVLKDGKIVVEWYYDQFTEDSIWYWASAGKSLTAFLVGLAQEEGFLDISSPSSEFLGGAGWTSAGLTEESQITIWHQLTMTTGLDDSVTDSDCWESDCLQYLANAGTRWAYHNAPYTLLDSVIATATEMSINQYYLSRVGFPIGAIGSYVPVGYNSVFFSNARAMARFGLLMLAEGNWNGDQIMTDEVYFNQMINTSQKPEQILWLFMVVERPR